MRNGRTGHVTEESDGSTIVNSSQSPSQRTPVMKFENSDKKDKETRQNNALETPSGVENPLEQTHSDWKHVAQILDKAFLFVSIFLFVASITTGLVVSLVHVY